MLHTGAAVLFFGMTLEIQHFVPAFQSEKTGSTPVGSAKNTVQTIEKYESFGSEEIQGVASQAQSEDWRGGRDA